MFFVFVFKQKTAYELRISDWSSDVCSSDLIGKQHATGFIIGSRKARFLGMNHLVGDQRGLKFMVIPQPSLSEKVINRAASPTHSFESFGIISTDSFSFHSLGVGSLDRKSTRLNSSH